MRVFPMKKHQNVMGNDTLTAIHFTVTTFRITRFIMRCTPNMHGWESGGPNVLSRVETAVTWPNTCVLTSTEPLSLELRTHQTYFPPRSQLQNDALQALSLSLSAPPPSLSAMLWFPVKVVLRFIYNIQEQSEIPKSPTSSPYGRRLSGRRKSGDREVG